MREFMYRKIPVEKNGREAEMAGQKRLALWKSMVEPVRTEQVKPANHNKNEGEDTV